MLSKTRRVEGMKKEEKVSIDLRAFWILMKTRMRMKLFILILLFYKSTQIQHERIFLVKKNFLLNEFAAAVDLFMFYEGLCGVV